jgi:5'(3')-deoxyribonucleotidase
MTIFLDMDGVLADFFGGLEKRYNVKHWKELNEATILGLKNTDFFDSLDPFPSSAALVAEVISHSKGDWGICSSPLRDDFANSTFWKRKWLTRMQWLPEIEKLIFTSRKHKYAVNKLDGKPNILIDDKPSNIKDWNKAGGIGILYQANKDSLQYVSNGLEDAVRRAK